MSVARHRIYGLEGVKQMNELYLQWKNKPEALNAQHPFHL